MRISDWSSDVCSADLSGSGANAGNDVIDAHADAVGDLIAGDAASSDPTGGNATVTNDAVADLDGMLAAAGNDVIVAGNGNDTLSGGALAAGAGARAKAWNAAQAEGRRDRKSVVAGTSGSGGGEAGGCCDIQ